MTNNNAVVKLKGLRPSSQKKHHYVFAKDQDDFAEFTGGKPYGVNVASKDSSTFKTVLGLITDKYIYIYCTTSEDIKGLRNIEVSLTKEFNSSRTASQKQILKTEIEICNFQSTQHFNPEHIPTVLKSLMAETAKSGELLKNPIVGMVIRSRKNYPPIDVSQGDIGVIVGIYGPQQNNATVIFSNGQHCGFAQDFIDEEIEFSHLSTHEHIKDYKYTTIAELCGDYDLGYFDSEFDPESDYYNHT